MVILMPFLVAIIVALGDRNFAIFLPSFSMYQCGHWSNIDEYHNSIDVAVCVWINYEFLLCVMFFTCTFWLRNINDEFSINTEIRTMTTVLFITDACYIASIIYLYDSVFVVLGFA